MADDVEGTRAARAQDGSTTPMVAPARRVPIIIVPGVMGTRLADENGELVWNPKGELPPRTNTNVLGSDAGPFRANTERLANNSVLHPDVRNIYNPSVGQAEFHRQLKIVNFWNLMRPYYGKLMLAMNEDLAVALAKLKTQVEPKVYAFGYDWRQDNAKSAALLGKRVAEARAECNDEQCIIIAHSMGGLVARHFCKRGGETSVRALFLLGSPSLGALKPYVWLKEGISNFEGDFMLKNVALGKTTLDSRNLLRTFPSAYQLIPTEYYGQHVDAQWLRFDARQTGYPVWNFGPSLKPVPEKQFHDCRDLEKLYGDVYTGLADPDKRPFALNALRMAAQFHAALINKDGTVYMPPEPVSTYCVYNESFAKREHRTMSRVTVPFKSVSAGNGILAPVRVEIGELETDDLDATGKLDAGGDGSVPVQSANPAHASPKFKDHLRLDGVEHGNIPNHPKTIDFLLNVIPTLV